MTALRKVAPDVAGAAAIALAIFLAFGHAFLNYDTFYALVWGDDLANGRTPQYDVPVAPTPHPLAIAVGVLLAPFGAVAEEIVLALVLLAVGALCVGLFRLGQTLYAWPVGLLAAAIAATRVPFLNYGIRGYVDLPTVALIVWAAVLEARRPRRGAPVLVLLALAGLLRPEAWLFAGAYWLWLAPALAPRRRLALAALVAAAPLVWVLSDLLVTGNPLWSLLDTREGAATLQRRTGLTALPAVLPFRLGEILRLPELIAAVLGAAAGLAWLRRRTLLPLAIAVLNGLAFVALAIARLPLLGRYLFVAAAMLALLAAVGALGWTALGRGHPRRTLWRAGGALLLTAFVFFLPAQRDRLQVLRDDVAARDRIQADLLSLTREPAAERAFSACGPVFVPNHRAVPLLALWTDTRPAEVISAQLERPTPDGLFVAPATREVELLSVLDPRDPKRLDAEVPGDYRRVAANRSWILYSGTGASCLGGTQVAVGGDELKR